MMNLSIETLNLITRRLDDIALCALRATCRFFRQNAGSNSKTSDFLCRAKLRHFKLIPTYLIERILVPQPPRVINALVELLPAIRSVLLKVMSAEPHAEWILFALINRPMNVKELLGDAIATTRDDTGFYVYHYYALAGHWESFKEHIDTYFPGFTYDINDACCNEISRNAILGGHVMFYDNLIKDYHFPDYRTDADTALFLLPSAIASGKLETVKTLAAMRPEIPPSDAPIEPLLGYDYLANAVRLGHAEIFAYLIAGDQPLCSVRTTQEAAEVFTIAAEFDNLELVKYFLEDPHAIQTWQFDLSTADEGETLRSRALLGGSKKVLAYLLEKDPTLLTPKEGEVSALFIAAENKQIAMCRHLIATHNIDPKTMDANGLCCLHYAAIGGDYDCYKKLADSHFPNARLLTTKHGETPLHFAAQHGRYWFLKQALEDFGPAAFAAKTKDDETVLDYAMQSDNKYVIEFLSELCSNSQEFIETKVEEFQAN